MNYVLAARAQFLDFIYICRAIFHVTAVNGTGLSFYNCIAAIKK
ncbi:RAxF-45 family protein [Ectobacillus sp. JY-23]|nr:RAxF-45 family protein [Ectobacillus sp. JY-23]